MAELEASIVTEPTTLAPLDGIPSLHRGLIAVSFFGLLSFVCSVLLFFRLAWRLMTWRQSPTPAGGGARINQFVILLFNLIFADIQQASAFMLNAHWLRKNSITVGTSTCWAQGWFVSTGDLGSGLFTLAIALHAFADIVCDFRLGPRIFGTAIAGLWVFNYLCAVIGIAMHPRDYYARAGAWCWINTDYTNERLWLHYFWVIIAEFGTVLIYLLIFLILRKRVKDSFYTTPATAIRAKSAAKIIIAYPIVYVVCTLPLVKARLTAMAEQHVSFVELCIAGCMITSNGWLDVLLYTLTRQTTLFGSDAPEGAGGILDTFKHRPDQDYGTTTVIEAAKVRRTSSRRRPSQQAFYSRTGSQEELFAPTRQMNGVKTETTVVVRNEAMELGPMSPTLRMDNGEMSPGLSKEGASWDARSESRSHKSGGRKQHAI